MLALREFQERGPVLGTGGWEVSVTLPPANTENWHRQHNSAPLLNTHNKAIVI